MLTTKHTSLLLRYGVAVLAVGMALLVKLLLDPLMVQGTPFLLIFGAIMISAWYGGLGPGLLATFTGGLAADYFFLPSTGSLSGFSLETVPLLVFFLEGTLVCLLVEALRAARARAEGSALEAERQRELLRTLVEHVPAITYTAEIGGEHALAYVSPQIEEVLGYSPGEVVEDTDRWTKMLHPHDRRWVLAEDRRAGQTGDPFALEYRMFAK